MPLIVDANTASVVFTPTPADDFKPVQQAIFSGRAIAVYGGKLAEEYARMRSYTRLLRELDRRGVLRKFSDADIRAMTATVTEEHLCVSDDPHIIALARVSNTRLLCSNDQALHHDFTNPRLLKPAGSVYQNRAHQHLLRVHCGRDQASTLQSL